jgi:hypothetical protein
MSKPKFLLNSPEPRPAKRSFHGKSLLAWEGVADINSILGWVENPRLELELKTFTQVNAGRQPDQGEILEIMKAHPDFKLKILAEDIRRNGVRTPLVLSSEGTLLDGNRRFFAVKYLLEITPDSDVRKDEFKRIPVLVLDETCSTEDEQLVVIHENFYANLKLPWPDIVLARFVYQALENGESAKSVAQKYDWPTAKVTETKKIMTLINEFIVFSSTDKPEGLGMGETDVEHVANENYQFFNEAQKSFYLPLQTDYEFKTQFFKWIHEDKFSSFGEVRIAWQAWQQPDLRDLLTSKNENAAADALAEIRYQGSGRSKRKAAALKIKEFSLFLNNLKPSEIADLSTEEIDELSSIAKTVESMAKSVKDGN